MNFFRILLCIAAVASLPHCAENNLAEHDALKPIIPLAVGNYWVYEVRTNFAIGETQRFLDTVKIIADTVIDGERWYARSEGRLITNRDRGLYSWDEVTEQAFLCVRHPAHQGEIYQKFYTRFASLEFELLSQVFTVANLRARMNVPAGIFNCSEHRADAELIETPSGNFPLSAVVSFYTPGVGLIKNESFTITAIDTSFISRSELRHYHVAQ